MIKKTNTKKRSNPRYNELNLYRKGKAVDLGIELFPKWNPAGHLYGLPA